ncbi:MAG: hypothetical protein PHD04_03735 [Candidatus Pacebacteria bacterium]|nr:hypothetical protein [Candidatus Paceibacterota bacterium]
MKNTAKKNMMKVGAGLAAAGAAAAAAGYYYFYGSTTAKKHRKIAAKWATAMKKEVLKETKRLEKASPKAFAAIVDRVAKTYEIARSVDTAELRRAAKELKENWETVQREAKRTVRGSVARAKKTVRKGIQKPY